MHDPGIRAVFAALDGGGRPARIVGGAVRDSLMGLVPHEFDFATPLTPDEVRQAAEAAGMKVVPTGIDHGTQTLVFAGQGFEVTTLREDVETDGRHAVVRFGSDWEADARRRDLTINALSVDADGTVYDPVGGYPDILARRVHFIGDADARIAEDRLRILRLFRFQAQIGAGAIDTVALGAAIRARNDLRALSPERVGQEMRRLLVGVGAADTLQTMQDAGILPIVLAGVGNVAVLRHMIAYESAAERPPSVPLRLAALAVRIREDVERLTDRLRLSNADRDAMLAAAVTAPSLAVPPSPRAMRALVYRLGADAAAGGMALAAAWSGESLEPWLAASAVARHWTAPRFPLTGSDVMAAGVARGPAVGTHLRALEDWWIGEDFAPSEAALRHRLQQIVAAQH